MADRIHQQLNWPDWRRRLRDLVCDSACAEPREQAFHLRRFLDIVGQAPDVALLAGIVSPSYSRLEAMIDCGACESAALAFVDPRTGCMISRGADGFHLASIALPGRHAEASASGATLALAVLGALATAIVGLAGGPVHAGAGIMASRLLH
ncbi:MAG TPA: hypothetical protein VIR81_11765 [Myxococcales bacterium]